jgi:hypothetical protein
MFCIDETIEVDNPAEVLRDQDGVFAVVSPWGHTFRVSCHRGSKMNVREINQPVRPVSTPGTFWQIRKIPGL